uniref:uncharacterized protein LOC117263726 isoform X2 n=1 Tax=Epinephelus lanceolatus TaxID=310571 RepID=UPI001446EEBB|nr:uncharacterized protein LOC117263726 isoform X2 [Epinephelus lanceolatus]
MESKQCLNVETKSKMSKAQILRASVKQRLTAAAEEIFGLFERTIAEYEEELSRSKEENERQRKLLDAVFSPQLQLHIAGPVWFLTSPLLSLNLSNVIGQDSVEWGDDTQQRAMGWSRVGGCV